MAPAEGLSTPSQDCGAGGPPFPAPITPPRGSQPGAEGPAGQRPARGDPAVGGGWSPPAPLLSPHPGAGVPRTPNPPAWRRVPDPPIPIPIPPLGRTSVSASSPAPWEPLCPFPPSSPPLQGARQEGSPLPFPFQLNRTSPSRQRRLSGAMEPTPSIALPRPHRPPQAPRWGGMGKRGHPWERVTPIPGPGAGSWDRKP